MGRLHVLAGAGDQRGEDDILSGTQWRCCALLSGDVMCVALRVLRKALVHALAADTSTWPVVKSCPDDEEIVDGAALLQMSI